MRQEILRRTWANPATKQFALVDNRRPRIVILSPDRIGTQNLLSHDEILRCAQDDIAAKNRELFRADNPIDTTS